MRQDNAPSKPLPLLRKEDLKIFTLYNMCTLVHNIWIFQALLFSHLLIYSWKSTSMDILCSTAVGACSDFLFAPSCAVHPFCAISFAGAQQMVHHCHQYFHNRLQLCQVLWAHCDQGKFWTLKKKRSILGQFEIIWSAGDPVQGSRGKRDTWHKWHHSGKTCSQITSN